MSAGIAVLGSTGSVGTCTLRVLARQRERFHVVALTAHGSRAELEAQGEACGARFLGIVDPRAGNGREWRVSKNGPPERAAGPEALVEAATRPDVDIVVNAIVGAAGLQATLAALEQGKRVALANKETLVMAGELVSQAAKRGGGEIVPIDSEHSAVLQCITGKAPTELSRLILTASGGPFRDWKPDRLAKANVDEALNHPTWSMGRKITIDSATLANKALEVVEAHHLFGLGYDSIEVVVHPQSIVHGFAEFVDGSILAQVGYPSMELPILYALTHPARVADQGVKRFDPVASGDLTFEALRHDAFNTFALGVNAGRTGGTAPAVFNAANEVAVEAFLDRRIAFGQIPEVIAKVLDQHANGSADRLEAVLEADRWARETAEAACS